MAFIREYAAAGDPFTLRRPKWLRKLKPGKLALKGFRGAAGLIKRVAPAALSFVPGVGGLASRLFAISDRYGLPRELATDFARSYGIEMGDPEDFDTDEVGGGMSGYTDDEGVELDYMGDPAPRPAKKRKVAGSGPRAKAAKKKAKRRERAQRSRGPGALERGLGAVTRTVGRAGKYLPGILAGGAQLLEQSGSVRGGNQEAAFAEMAAALGGKAPKFGGSRMTGFGGKRRTMNPANVRALKRSMRRVEGFQGLVKRMQKAFPALRGPTTRLSSPRRAQGHRAGCGCVVCKRAA